MQQILQSLKTGDIILEEVPCPKNMPNTILIETTHTLISAGTERMLLEFGKANWFGKMKQQPDKVKMVLEKIKTDGLFATLDAVKAKLDQPIPLGYCHVGKILEMGEKVTHFKISDRVISSGYHAEMVRMNQNNCAKIPDNVSDEEAAFTVVSAIALQGIRLSQPTLGECYVVIGLGLIGLLTVQLLKAQGCRVLGVDFDAKKCALAKQFGAEISYPDNLILEANSFSRGRGVDAVIITAATQSNEPLRQAATVCRKRGRIILIGVIGKEFSRVDFYEKELSFQVSCSFGPGRYDEQYEKQGIDYPVGFVRWTMQRNFEAVLDMMSQKTLDVRPLISQHFDIDDVLRAYQALENDPSSLGIVIHYPDSNVNQKTKTSIVLSPQHQANAKSVSIGLVGAGNYGASVLAPAFKKSGAHLQAVVSSEGLSAKRLARQFNFKEALSDEQLVLNHPDINTIVIATRHHLHANQVIQALEKNKHVFVEKPLAIRLDDVEKIRAAYQKNQHHLLMIGFNRRFSPHMQIAKKLLEKEFSPKTIVMTINAGALPKTHWAQDHQMGGGRIVGEACHFIDLSRFLIHQPIVSWQAMCADTDDKATILLKFADQSCSTIHYFSHGHKRFPRERIEIFCNGKILQCHNFRKLIGFGWKNFKKKRDFKQNKGQVECVNAFVEAIHTGKISPIPFEEIMEVSKISIEIAEYLTRIFREYPG